MTLWDDGQTGSKFDGRGSTARLYARSIASLPSRNLQFGWLQSSQKMLNRKKFWLRGVDLNPRAVLILRKLLILRYAKLAQMARTANLSYTFLTLCPIVDRSSH